MNLQPPKRDPQYQVDFQDGKSYVVEADSWVVATRKAVALHRADIGPDGQGCKIKDITPISDCPDIVEVSH